MTIDISQWLQNYHLHVILLSMSLEQLNSEEINIFDKEIDWEQLNQ